jgi:hypothetical protein
LYVTNLLQFGKLESIFLRAGPCEQCGPWGNNDQERFQTGPCPTHQWQRDRGAARAGTCRVPAGSTSCQPTDADVQDRSHPLRLPTPIKDHCGQSYHSFHCFSPNAELSHHHTRCRLAAVSPRHSSIPCAWILPVTLLSYSPPSRITHPLPTGHR